MEIVIIYLRLSNRRRKIKKMKTNTSENIFTSSSAREMRISNGQQIWTSASVGGQLAAGEATCLIKLDIYFLKFYLVIQLLQWVIKKL